MSHNFDEAFDAIADAFGITIAIETALEEHKDEYVDAWQERNCSASEDYNQYRIVPLYWQQ